MSYYMLLLPTAYIQFQFNGWKIDCARYPTFMNSTTQIMNYFTHDFHQRNL